jgi:hypothetical protein
MKTLQREEIYANQYKDLADLRTHIEEFIEQYYNRQRLHSALAYKGPVSARVLPDQLRDSEPTNSSHESTCFASSEHAITDCNRPSNALFVFKAFLPIRTWLAGYHARLSHPPGCGNPLPASRNGFPQIWT